MNNLNVCTIITLVTLPPLLKISLGDLKEFLVNSNKLSGDVKVYLNRLITSCLSNPTNWNPIAASRLHSIPNSQIVVQEITP